MQNNFSIFVFSLYKTRDVYCTQSAPATLNGSRIKSALNEISDFFDSSFYFAAHFSFSHPLTQRALTSINYVKAPVGSARSNSDSNKKRVVKLVSIVILTFTVSWLPLQVSRKLSFHFFPLLCRRWFSLGVPLVISRSQWQKFPFRYKTVQLNTVIVTFQTLESNPLPHD